MMGPLRPGQDSWHEPVMTDEVVSCLEPGPDDCIVDCTVGAGGHARALLEAGAGRVIGIDRDAEVLAKATEALARWSEQVELVHADYREIEAVLDARGVAAVDGAVADLGMSSFQLAGTDRGFSFRRDELLDMRMDRSRGPTAADLLREVPELDLANIIFRYGGERYSRRIARAIARERQQRPLATTGQLAALVRRVVPRRGRLRIDPATRTFQALRIWVNEELEGLDRFLRAIAARLRAGARMVIITFHSLEDRIVKTVFRELSRQHHDHDAAVAMRVLTRRPMRPGRAEILRNPRARSAKLRAAERLPVPGKRLEAAATGC